MKLKHKISSFARFKWRGLKTIRADQQGLSAIEFAIIAPFMVFLYFGSIELMLLMQADRRVTTATATAGDLASRFTTLTNDDLGDIFMASRQLLNPLDPDIAEMRVSSLVSDDRGTVTVAWSEGCGAEPRTLGSSVAELPAGIVPPNGSVVLAEVEYEYTSAIEYLPSAQRRLGDRFFLRPRRTEVISRDTNTGNLPGECL